MSQTPVPITGGTGSSSIAAELVSGTSFQQIEVYGGGGASVLSINPDGSIKTSILGTPNVNVAGSVVGFQGGSRTISGSVLAMFAPVASLVSGVSSVITSTSQTSVLATAPGAQRNYITHVIVTNAAAVGTVVNIMDGPNVLYAGYAAASGGGFASSFPTPLKQSNLVTSVDVKAVTQASVLVAIVGYTGA